MRDPRNRLKVKRLFVLGAGASFSASRVKKDDSSNVTPLDKDFCKRILNLTRTRKPGWVSEKVEEIIKNWRDHESFEGLGLESAIIRQLSHLEFVKAIQLRRRIDYTEQEFLNSIAHLIVFILKKARESRHETYRKLTDNVFPRSSRSEEIKNKNRIITFNYDDLLDRHLIDRFKVERLYFDKIRRSRDQSNQRRKISFEDPFLVKLHGSVNWRCKKGEFSKIIDNTSRGGTELVTMDSVWCSQKGVPSPYDDNDYPCIIPPMPEKPITSIGLFKYLWTKAAEYLSMAEEIIICGYSLPDTDPIAFSLFSNFENPHLKKVVVIDPDPAILNKWRALFNRRRVHKAEWTYHWDFAEYVDSL